MAYGRPVLLLAGLMCTKRMSVIVHGTIGETKYSSMIVQSVSVAAGHEDAILWTACEHMHGSMDQLGAYRQDMCQDFGPQQGRQCQCRSCVQC